MAQLDTRYNVPFMVERYRLTADADDTACIVRAIAACQAAGGGTVKANPGKTYTVSPQGTTPFTSVSGSSTTLATCIVIPAGVTLDMMGSTIKLGGTSPATLIANSNMTGSGTTDSNIGLINVVVDGSNISLTAGGLVTWAYITKLTMNHFKIINGTYQGVYAIAISNSYFDDLNCDTFTGNPFCFGSPTTNLAFMMTDSHIGTVRSTNVTALYVGGVFQVSQPGNPFGGSYMRCTIDSIECRNSDSGIKIQGPGEEVVIGKVYIDSCGTSASTYNSGFKLQGDSTNGWYPKHMSVGQIIARNQGGQGLYMELTVDCTVGSYIGVNNATSGTVPDGMDRWDA